MLKQISEQNRGGVLIPKHRPIFMRSTLRPARRRTIGNIFLIIS